MRTYPETYELYAAQLRRKERYRRCVRALAEVIASDCYDASVEYVEDDLFDFCAETILDNEPEEPYQDDWWADEYAYRDHIESQISARREDG